MEHGTRAKRSQFAAPSITAQLKCHFLTPHEKDGRHSLRATDAQCEQPKVQKQAKRRNAHQKPESPVLELELILILPLPQMAQKQKPVLRGSVGARVQNASGQAKWEVWGKRISDKCNALE